MRKVNQMQNWNGKRFREGSVKIASTKIRFIKDLSWRVSASEARTMSKLLDSLRDGKSYGQH